MVYVLEVVRYIRDYVERDKKGGMYEHVGYMKAKFRTRQDACSYYDRHNPHMRPMNVHNTFESDWDQNNDLLYIVREDYCIIANIDTFDKNDMPIIEDGVITYQYLK